MTWWQFTFLSKEIVIISMKSKYTTGCNLDEYIQGTISRRGGVKNGIPLPGALFLLFLGGVYPIPSVILIHSIFPCLSFIVYFHCLLSLSVFVVRPTSVIYCLLSVISCLLSIVYCLLSRLEYWFSSDIFAVDDWRW